MKLAKVFSDNIPYQKNSPDHSGEFSLTVLFFMCSALASFILALTEKSTPAPIAIPMHIPTARPMPMFMLLKHRPRDIPKHIPMLIQLVAGRSSSKRGPSSPSHPLGEACFQHTPEADCPARFRRLCIESTVLRKRHSMAAFYRLSCIALQRYSSSCVAQSTRRAFRPLKIQ